MLRYNHDSLQIRFWKRELEQTITDRTVLKKELLDLLSDNEKLPYQCLYNFNKKRNALLGDEHDQGWSWTSHFDWFWNFLLYLGFIKENPMAGSKLRQVLTKTPPGRLVILNPAELAERESGDSQDFKLDKDEDFEQALFSDSPEALLDVSNRISTLAKLETGLRPHPDLYELQIAELQIALKRLEAIKYRLAPEHYRQYLEELFDKAPQVCLSFFYNLHREERTEDFTQPHEYFESYYMTRALLDQFVAPRGEIKEDPINATLYELLYLIAVLVTDENQFQSLINTSGEVNALYKSHLKVKEKILPMLEATMDQTRFKSKDYDNPLTLVEDIFTYLNPSSSTLLRQIARLATEQLAITLKSAITHDKRQDWFPKSIAYLVLQFLTTNITGTWKQSSHKFFEEPSACDALVSPYSYGSKVPSLYQRAERCATEILINGAMSEGKRLGFVKAREILKDYMKDPKPYEMDWIFSRIKAVQPELLPPIEALFKNPPHYYNEEILKLWSDSAIPQENTEDLFNKVHQLVKQAYEANLRYDLNIENECNQEALSLFYHFLKRSDLTPTQIASALYDLLPTFKETCARDVLIKLWEIELRELHKRSFHWSLEEVKPRIDKLELSTEANPLEVAKELHKQAKERQNDLNQASSKIDYEQRLQELKELSQEAVCYFALFVEQTDNRSSSHYADAQAFLNEYLSSFLKEEQLFAWNKALSKLNSPASVHNLTTFFSPLAENSQIGSQISKEPQESAPESYAKGQANS
ncbi:hypothetical protein [Legionella jordanis]|uniref:Uncharacterized protein n=1 Tax=Legionella jordanis TaxID=456 RepID=A0A0W0VE00_9GAMM|nr:hypothetical protein [Legionella jordanis]KTD18359.1 hypothetical protein Ljor_2665 [Legionella jordanis]VEH13295.1 Uncharacterised protein [Legionella jordanis]